MQQALVSWFTFGVFERFPNLRLGCMEAGGGWIGALLDRLDGMFLHTGAGRQIKAPLLPSEYFRRQGYISIDPEERAAMLIMEHIGEDCWIYGSDYPHPSHPVNGLGMLSDRFATLSDTMRDKVVGGNLAAIYGIDRQALARSRV
jgi:predicted TIM-barrel fold metal-dependent hydrolase